jgi:hypothetical protein
MPDSRRICELVRCVHSRVPRHGLAHSVDAQEQERQSVQRHVALGTLLHRTITQYLAQAQEVSNSTHLPPFYISLTKLEQVVINSDRARIHTIWLEETEVDGQIRLHYHSR